MHNSKYIVFKRDDYYEELGRLMGHNHSLQRGAKLNEIELEDAIVVRKQDRFSAPAMQSYFDAVSNTIEVLTELGVPTDAEVMTDLELLRDWAFNTTQEAREFKDKSIPELASELSVLS